MGARRDRQRFRVRRRSTTTAAATPARPAPARRSTSSSSPPPRRARRRTWRSPTRSPALTRFAPSPGRRLRAHARRQRLARRRDAGVPGRAGSASRPRAGRARRPRCRARWTCPARTSALWHGSRVEGTVFRDDGAGGSAANDGARQAGESGLAGARLRAASAACAGGVCDSALTDGAGRYTLWLPAGAAGRPVQVIEANPAGWLSDRRTRREHGRQLRPRRRRGRVHSRPPAPSTAGPTSATCRPTASPATGSGAGPRAAALFYAHTFVAGTAGTVTFAAREGAVTAAAGLERAALPRPRLRRRHRRRRRAAGRTRCPSSPARPSA